MKGSPKSLVNCKYSKIPDVESGPSNGVIKRPCSPSRSHVTQGSRPSLVLMTLCLLVCYALFVDIYNTAQICARARNWKPNAQTPATTADMRSVTGFTPKQMMEDMSVGVVFDPIAKWFEDTTNFSFKHKWLTANMVTFTHLVLGLLSAWLVSRDYCWHRLAVLLFMFRCALDAYDGIVARMRVAEARAAGAPPSKHPHLGYYLDGLADGAATMAYFLGVFFYYLKNPPKLPSLMNFNLHLGRITIPLAPPFACTRFSSLSNGKQIFLIIFNYGLLSITNSVFWNNFILTYTSLLDDSFTTTEDLQARLAVVSSVQTQVIFWFWRVTNVLFLAIIGCVIATFFGRTWEYMCVFRWVGWILLLILALATKIHTIVIRHKLHHS